ncbi:MAG: hypothetical protein RL469_446 [Pseudomonadota bacterium]|jgi:uncharacterized protein YbjT (DUF2867 family)|nr:SDR family oxidoreductase [Gammaproteobacteria bacterium]
MNATTNRIRRSISLAVLAVLLPAAIFVSDAVHAASTAGRVLVVGATGGTGREVVQQARAKGYKVRALVRDADKARTLLGSDVELVVGDVRTDGTFERAVKGVDYVVSALGSNSRNDPTNKPEAIDYGAVKSLAAAAAAAKVKQIVLVSSIGVTDPNAPLNRMFDNILLWKFKGEEAVRGSGVAYTIVRPGGLTNDAGGQRRIKTTQGDPRGAGGRIPRADVAAICVNALGRRDAERRTFEVVSDEAQGTVDWNTFFAGLTADAR